MFNVSCHLSPVLHPVHQSGSMCGCCQTEDCCWSLPRSAFSLAHVQAPIQALICRVTDDQWPCWPTWFCCGRRWARDPCSHWGTDMNMATWQLHVKCINALSFHWFAGFKRWGGIPKLPDPAHIRRQSNSDPGSDLISHHSHNAFSDFH